MSTAKSQVPIYFGGKVKEPVWKPLPERDQTMVMFLHYLNTVWVHQHTVPTERASLANIDLNALMREYRAFLQAGGKPPERGASLEEFWLGTQLYLRSPITCLRNVAQPDQEVARITRLRRLSAAEIWAEIQQAYANPVLKRSRPDMTAGLNPLPMFVYDGDQIAHIINAWTIHQGELHFMDPWPARSLLCAEHNSAGVAARESNLIQRGWQITRSEFERAVFAVCLHTLAEPRSPVWNFRHVELTEDELEAAEQQKLLLQVVRRMNRPGTKPIEGVQWISRLECAARLNRVWEVKLAINEGDYLNERGNGDNSALHVAAEMGHLEIVKLLAEHGADRYAHNAEGKTPAELATAKGHSAVAQYLESLG